MLSEGIQFDDIHYDISVLDGYNKAKNFCWSPRELGKSTSILVQKTYKRYKEFGEPTLFLYNMAADITEAQVISMENSINKFKGREVHLSVSKDCSTIWCVWDGNKKERRLFAILASVGAPIRRLKGLNFGKLACIVYDECIINTSMGEKYPKALAFKIKEIYKTFARESRPALLKLYCFGNPYSKYHPLLVDWGVPINQIKKGTILAGKDWVVQAAVLSDKLKDWIIKNDPNHDWDDTYEKYAFEGDAINDDQVWIEEKQPEGYKLKWCFKIQDRYLWVWRMNPISIDSVVTCSYWIEAKAEPPGKRRDVISADFESMTRNSVLLDVYRGLFDSMKRAVALNRVSYSSPEAYYLIQLIYTTC
jgi:hypothetical protein